MENAAPANRDLPVIEKDKSGKRKFVCWRGKQFGPWDELNEEFRYSPDNSRWAIRGRLHGRHYVLCDMGRYGPFDHSVRQLSFDPARGAFVFTARRGNEFMLLAEGKILKKGRIVEKPSGESFVIVNRKRFGPYRDIHFPQFSQSGKKWAAEVWREDRQCFLLLNGKEYGPFKYVGAAEFSGGVETCACKCGNDLGNGLLLDGVKFFGPYEDVFGPFFSPDGRRWGLDVRKKKGWNGFLVDGVEYGPFPYQFFVPRFSPDSRHWFVTLDSGYEDRPHSFILDGFKYGRFKISEAGFMEDGLFICVYRQRGRLFIHLGDHLLGPYRFAAKDAIRAPNATIADMTFTRKGKRSLHRGVISYKPEGSEKSIFFSPHSGESVADAIEIINAVDPAEGIAAEYAYLRLRFASLGKEFNVVRQALLPNGGKHYDILTIEFKDGQQEDFYFDITGFYGKSGNGLNE